MLIGLDSERNLFRGLVNDLGVYWTEIKKAVSPQGEAYDQRRHLSKRYDVQNLDRKQKHIHFQNIKNAVERRVRLSDSQILSLQAFEYQDSMFPDEVESILFMAAQIHNKVNNDTAVVRLNNRLDNQHRRRMISSHFIKDVAKNFDMLVNSGAKWGKDVVPEYTLGQFIDAWNIKAQEYEEPTIKVNFMEEI